MNNLKILCLLLATTQAVLAQSSDELELSIDNLSKTWEVREVINEEKSKEEIKELLTYFEAVTFKLKSDLTFTFSFVLDLEGTWSLKNNNIYTIDKKGENKWVIHSLKKTP